jgi:hypothetical protein
VMFTRIGARLAVLTIVVLSAVPDAFSRIGK